jgi:histidyl-tRNA synthetase
MHMTIDNASQFRDEFHRAGRQDQFSYEGLGLLFDLFEEVDPDMDLDVIAVCCEFSEESPADIARNYSIDLNDADPEDDDYEAQCLEAVLSYVSNNTTVAGVTRAGDIVYANF